MPMLDVDRLSVRYGTKQIVDALSFSVSEGQWLMIAGPNGAGKSTALAAITQGTPYTGRVLFEGQNVRSMKPALRARAIGVLAQNHFVGYGFTVEEVVRLGRFAYAGGVFGRSQEDDAGHVEQALTLTGLQDKRRQSVLTLSGGELQRVSIARALITRPKLIIADEPVAAIDASMKMNIVNLFKELKDKYKVSFIYVTHDLSTAYYVSDYIATLYRGCLIEYGPAKEIMDEPAHPYTELLMSAVPRIGDKWADDDMALPDMESKEYSITYCKFAPRCPYATDECRKSRPGETYLNDVRKVMCFHPLIQPKK